MACRSSRTVCHAPVGAFSGYWGEDSPTAEMMSYVDFCQPNYVFSMPYRQPFVLLATALLLVGCSGSQAGTDEGGPAPDEPRREEGTQEATVAQYETFDASSYPVQPPEQTVEVSHQVPKRLMQSRADEGARQTVEGYRIQVFSSDDQNSAQDVRESVRQWWERASANAPDDLFQDQPPIVIKYSQPYYRVRIGAFAEREAAEKALEFVRKEYEGAFVAQGTVTVVQ